MVTLNVFGDSKAERELQRIFKKTIENLSVVQKGHINLVFVGIGKIEGLNRDYRGKDKATDVLSFVYGDLCIGEILICKEYIKGNIRESLDVDIKKAFIHGILHIFGFDHEKSESERVKMEMKEREIYELVK